MIIPPSTKLCTLGKPGRLVGWGAPVAVSLILFPEEGVGPKKLLPTIDPGKEAKPVSVVGIFKCFYLKVN